MAAIYSVLLVSLLMAVASANSNCSNSNSSSYYIDIFQYLLTHEPDKASILTTPPLIQGTILTDPAYEFRGMGSGFSITELSDKIRAASCLYNEVTFTGHIFIRDSQSDGPLMELSYAGGLESGLNVYLLHMDSAANEIVVAYRHQGQLHSESIPVRLISGRWRDYAITLSGNQLSFYFDCKLEFSRLIPLPDYCSNDSSIILTVANSMNRGIEYTGSTGLYIYAQKLGIHFGPNGINQLCPDIPEACPTCGQFLSLVEELVAAREEVKGLKSQIDTLEGREVSCPTNEPTTASTGTSCISQDGSQNRVFDHGTFILKAQNTVCYCDNGHSVCQSIGALTVAPPTDNCPDVCTTAFTPNRQSPPTPQPPCRIRELSLSINLGDLVPDKLGNDCIIYSCETGRAGPTPRSERYDCSNEFNCSSSLTDKEKEAAICCGHCNACQFNSCPDNSECTFQEFANFHECPCLPGYSKNDSSHCVDVDECRLGFRDNGHNCFPNGNSICINTEGSFYCQCFPGFSVALDNLREVTCIDDDECQEGTHNCSAFSTCMNTPGGFKCICDEGYTNKDGICEPVCDPPCENYGTCSSPGNCTCLSQFKGISCSEDVDECKSADLNDCGGPKSTCINTYGGHFCRCEKGYHKVGNMCKDVNECSLRIHNCVSGSRCVNTIGSFACLCGSQGTVDCTGSCKRNGIIYDDGTSWTINCRRCTCLGGEVTCRKIDCDCKNPNVLPRSCCPECHRRDCTISVMGESIRIRPGSTWINPSNRCERYNCKQNLEAVLVNMSANCPELDCPVGTWTTPVGKCCPVCMLPTCERSLENRIVSLRNGCKTCICQNSTWSCTYREQCPDINCLPQDIVFFKNGCCPVCRQQVFSNQCSL